MIENCKTVDVRGGIILLVGAAEDAMQKAHDYTGKRFGRLVAIERGEPVYYGRQKKVTWRCQCDCGVVVSINASSLSRGLTTSCGCRKREVCIDRSLTHGMSNGRDGSGTYKSWNAMRNRCANVRSVDYPDYGGRGIGICDRWKSFAMFLDDMGLRPKHHSIERIDVNGDYNPGNCKWLLTKRQARNRRNTLWVNLSGERLSLVDACENVGIKAATVRRKKYDRGISIQDAFDIHVKAASK